MRTLVETVALEGERGAYRLTRSIQRLTIPVTVQSILAARIDRLAPEAKRLLQAAAVIGKDVALPLLLAIADVLHAAVTRSRDTLRRGHIVRRCHETVASRREFCRRSAQVVAGH